MFTQTNMSVAILDGQRLSVGDDNCNLEDASLPFTSNEESRPMAAIWISRTFSCRHIQCYCAMSGCEIDSEEQVGGVVGRRFERLFQWRDRVKQVTVLRRINEVAMVNRLMLSQLLWSIICSMRMCCYTD